MASDKKKKPPPKRQRPDGPQIDTSPPTPDEDRRAEELIRQHGWEHMREKP